MKPVPPVVRITSKPVVDEVVQPVLDEREVVGDDLHRDDVAAGRLGARGERRAGASSARRAETDVETVRIAVRTG